MSYPLIISLTFLTLFLPQHFQWTYVFIPLLFVRKFHIVNSFTSLFLFVFLLVSIFNILVSALFSSTDLDGSVVSFFVSLLPLLPLLCAFDSKVFRAMSFGLLLYALVISINSLWQYYLIGPQHIQILKGEIGSQRVAPILFFALFYLIDLRKSLTSLRAFANLPFVVILLGILFTLSRTSILALVSLPIAFSRHSVHSLLVGVRLRFSLQGAFKLTSAVLFISFVFSFLFYALFPDVLMGFVGFFDVSLLNASDSNSSEGFRFYLWAISFDYLFSHPFWGTAFNGCTSLIDNASCSYHSQYVDTLVRFGLPLSFLSLCFVFVVLRRSLSVPLILPFGFFVASSVLGLFHETYRYPSLALPFSLVMWYTMSKSPFASTHPLTENAASHHEV